jgi:hypothetical protein
MKKEIKVSLHEDEMTEVCRVESGFKRLERLRVTHNDAEKLRFSWWPFGVMAQRPLELSEAQLVNLLAKALNRDVLSKTFIFDLIEAVKTTRKEQQLAAAKELQS